ncbi:hypothetical protein IscW_ISCW012433 [Ixodes scapularis]|uniref:Uncharacterized protein n=1 Tax=Ixodes scapularis TaxID=6945 RepID=B7QFI3_IXOSC|nr:hypothetical protein IscW_ISCW012433 [Ixodes scapularis]|eukprot:XP_002414297.1 hypothetical protein IscW_ISCW012433 [Ixodes scapularis]
MLGLALVFLLVGLASCSSDQPFGKDEWREDLFLPGLKAQYRREHSSQGPSTEGKLKKRQYADYLAETESFDDASTFKALLKRRHSPWTYGCAFGAAVLFAIAFVVYNVRRSSRSDDDEVCHYDRLSQNQGDSAPPQQDLDVDYSSDIQAERLLLRPLLENSVCQTKKHFGFSRSRHGTERMDKPPFRSLWSKIMRSSRDAPNQFGSDSTTKGPRRSACTTSTLPTVTSRVESIQEMTEVEKTLWWRTM